MANEKPVKVKFTQERIEEVVTVDEFVGALSGNFRVTVNVVTKMVVGDDGAYLSDEDAKKEIGRITIGELKKLIDGIGKALRDALVNPTSGGT
jgi:hypothetical protein